MKAYVPNPNPSQYVYEHGFIYPLDGYLETELSLEEQAAVANPFWLRRASQEEQVHVTVVNLMDPQDDPETAAPGNWGAE